MIVNGKHLGKREYSLLGDDGRQAVEMGLAAAERYHADISRKETKILTHRSDSPTLRDNLLWIGSMILFAGAGSYLWPSIWSAPFWLAYGVLYGSASESRWHECGHGTAVKTDWISVVVYQIACFMIMRNPTTWRWSHARHRTDAIIMGRDLEIAVMRPPDSFRPGMNFFGLFDAWSAMKLMLLNARGELSPEEAICIPKEEAGKVYAAARIWVAIYLAAIASAVWYSSLLPLMIVGLPRLYGAWRHILAGALQHGGLADKVLDRRLNARKVCMNPISRFIYLKMNYRVEQHMLPMVSCNALPRLQKMIARDLPAPNTSMWRAFAEAWPIARRQLRYDDVYPERNPVPTAKPCRPHLNDLAAPA